MKAGTSLISALMLLCFASASIASAQPLQLDPFKDDLFAYPPGAVSGHGGDHLTIPFNYKRDVVDRDVEPDEKTRPEYVDLELVSSIEKREFRHNGQTVRYVGVGRVDGNAKIVTIFVHGLGATPHDALNDWRTGGNLNRIKNLMVRNDGAYLAIDFSAFPSKGKRQIAAMVDAVAKASPEAPIFLICSSMGARPCWRLAEDATAAATISGIFMIAPVNRSGFAKSATVRNSGKRIPIYMSIATRDKNVGWRRQEKLFKAIKAVAPDYPIKLVLFDKGVHRSPLRMTDWRLAINWMLTVGRN